MNWLLVFLGGGLGAVSRYGVARLLGAPDLTSGGFPWATLVTNGLACLLLAVGLAALGKGQLSAGGQLLLLTGFCGGFSTFSTFAYELFALGESGHWAVAAAYLLLSLLSGVGCLLIVFWLLGR